MEVTYKICKDIAPPDLLDTICGEIYNGIFYPYGSVAKYYFEKQQEFNQKEEKKKKQDVYFIQCGEDGPVKIGIAENVHKRLETLQIANPYKLQIIKTISRGGFSLEKKLHEKYKKYHIRNEWFSNKVLTF